MIESLHDYVYLLESNDEIVRRKATLESATVEVWLEILSMRPDLATEVAFNKNLPVEIIDLLIISRSSQVRSAIAMKRMLKQDHFQKLANDSDESVRIMIANNKITPSAILKFLSLDVCELVSKVANQRLKNCDNSS